LSNVGSGKEGSGKVQPKSKVFPLENNKRKFSVPCFQIHMHSQIKRVSSYHHMAPSKITDREIFRVAVNISNERSRTADKG
jgi:hypothetical protein